MKLSKILIPVVSIAGVTSIIAPAVTSCSCSGAWASVEWKVSDGEYHYQSPTKAATQIKSTEIISTYFNDIITTPKIFCEDYLYSASHSNADISIKKITVTLKGVSTTGNSSLFKVNFVTYIESQNQGEDQFTIVEFDGILMTLTATQYDKEKAFMACYQFYGEPTHYKMWTDKEWTIKTTIKTKNETKETTYNYESESDVTKQAEAINYMDSVHFYSYYLQNITLI